VPTPILASRLQFQDYQFQVALPAGIWKWVTRLDVSRSLPSFEVREVVSPYGRMGDMIPIPGEVITAMAASITTLSEAFSPAILLSPTTLTFTLNEGQGTSPAQPVQITNSGVFGSLLSAAITSSAPFVQTTPANVNGLSFNEAGQFNVTADSTNLLALGSPYAVALTVQDTDATNSPQVIPITVVVLPKAIITVSTPALVFNVQSPTPGDPYPPVPSQSFTLSNTGPAGSQLQYLIQKLIGCTPWLTAFNPFMGQLASTQSQLITVAVAPDPSMLPGTYQETLVVSGYSQNSTQNVQVTLVIT
jgi:hypothetical protein